MLPRTVFHISMVQICNPHTVRIPGNVYQQYTAGMAWRAIPCAMYHHTHPQNTACDYRNPHVRFTKDIPRLLTFAKSRCEIIIIRNDRLVAFVCQLRFVLKIIQRIPSRHLLFVCADDTDLAIFQLK